MLPNYRMYLNVRRTRVIRAVRREVTGEFQPPVAPGTWQQYYGVNFWVADLARVGRRSMVSMNALCD